MKTVIISGGSIQREFASGFLKTEKMDLLIAADRGLAFCMQEGIVPDRIIGDYDSVDRETAARFGLDQLKPGGAQHTVIENHAVTIERFRPEKDATDTELAVELAASLGADEITLLGGSGTRLDHVLGNLGLVFRMCSRGIRVWLVDANNRIHMAEPGEEVIQRTGQFGTNVSVIPWGGAVTGLTLSGFQYPLHDHTVLPGEESLCVSNRIIGEAGTIQFRTGHLLVIESRD